MGVNALGTANIFEAACRAGVGRILFLSSESVYGPQSAYGERPVTEEDYCAPRVYGAGRTRGTTVWASDFCSLPAQGLPVTLPFPADDANCYIYVEDLTEQIYLLSLTPALAHRIYNTGGHTAQGSELAALVRAALPSARIEFRDDGGTLAIYPLDG